MSIVQYLKFVLALALMLPVPTQEQSTLEALLNFIDFGQSVMDSEPLEPTELRSSYDFVIIGAGSAGCVLANRLTEVREWNVLLLEAGRHENFVMDIPLVTPFLQFSEVNWNYRTEPQPSGCLGMQNGRCHWPRGKVVGGSSVLHHMIHTRGNRKDYDRWEALGNDGWSYMDVLPYFKKSERFEVSEYMNDTKYHNTEGYLSISYPPWKTPLATAFLDAGKYLGYPIVDYNGATQEGFSYIQATIDNGTRHSLSRAFLHPVAHRPNLHVQKNAMVTRIIIDEKTRTATGVEFLHEGKLRRISASKEVIVSAGAINSPQVLMLSGIGPRMHLKKMDIKTIANLKVGYNLQDHIALGGLTFIINDTVSFQPQRMLEDTNNFLEYLATHNGPFSGLAGPEAIAFMDTRNRTDSEIEADPEPYPDVELLFIAGSYASMSPFKYTFAISDEIYQKVYQPIQSKDTWMVFPMLMLPKSAGRIMLRSKNPLKKPLIHPNYLAHPEDIETIIRGIKMALQISDSPAFQKYNSTLHQTPLPACSHLDFASDDYWRCAVKQLTQTIYHQSGTCKMGPSWDRAAVVDPRLKVHTMKGLRVIDASIMPFVPVAHTNGPTVMIAEKGADMIKEDWGQFEQTDSSRLTS